MKTKGYPHSNLERRSTNGRPRAHLLPWLGSTEVERHGRLGRRVRLAGLSGLAGLSSGKAKTSPRAGFSLIHQLRLG
jgi:hypothetical protein